MKVKKWSLYLTLSALAVVCSSLLLQKADDKPVKEIEKSTVNVKQSNPNQQKNADDTVTTRLTLQNKPDVSGLTPQIRQRVAIKESELSSMISEYEKEHLQTADRKEKQAELRVKLEDYSKDVLPIALEKMRETQSETKS